MSDRSYASEVVADSSGKFCGNMLRFATPEEASLYVADLARRWTLVTDTRVVETDDPVTDEIVDGVLRKPVTADLLIRDEGSIFLVEPTSPAGEAWVEENLPEDATTWGDRVVVEHRYIDDIAAGAAQDGLRVGKE